LIGHKEYRFISCQWSCFNLIAALGSADWIQWLLRNPPGRRSGAAGGRWWVGADLGGACGDRYDAGYWMNGTGAAQLAAELRDDPRALRSRALQDAFPLLPGGTAERGSSRSSAASCAAPVPFIQ